MRKGFFCFTQSLQRLLLINTTNLQNQIIFARRGRAGGQKGGPALACSDEASFCLDFFFLFDQTKRKSRNYKI